MRWPCTVVFSLVACVRHQAPDAPPQPTPPSKAAVPLAPASTASPTTPELKEDAAPIEAFRELARGGASAAQLDRHIAEHPELMNVRAGPYGSALAWTIEFAEPEASLALLRAGAPVFDGALTLAARGGLDELVKTLLDGGAKIPSTGFGPLHAAAKYGYVSTVQLLLARGANIGAADDDGFTALHHAVIERHEDLVVVLLAAKPPLEARDREGRTALAWGGFAYAPQAKHMYRSLSEPHDTVYVDPGPARAMELLIDAGARVDSTDDAGDTPLHHAAGLGSVRGCEALFAHGADAEAKNRAGETARALAERRGGAIAELFAKTKPRRR